MSNAVAQSSGLQLLAVFEIARVSMGTSHVGLLTFTSKKENKNFPVGFPLSKGRFVNT